MGRADGDSTAIDRRVAGLIVACIDSLVLLSMHYIVPQDRHKYLGDVSSPARLKGVPRPATQS